MRKVFAFAVVASLLLVALSMASACSPPQRARAVKLDVGDAGHRVELKTGQTLDISLEANPTTGYTWEAEGLDEHILQPVGEPEFKPQSNLIGAPGILALHFQAVGTGQTTLKLVYHRPWEKEVKPLETYSVEVVVR